MANENSIVAIHGTPFNRRSDGHIRLLEDPDFNFFLKLFHRIMPHVDILYAKLQNRNIDSVHINRCIQQFQEDIQKIRDSVHAMVVEHRSGSEQPRKRRAIDQDELKRIASEKREIHSAEEHELHIPEEEGRRSSHRSSTSKSALCPVQRPKTA
ncbi:unnamed protein product [Pleuronectes platessa]|uniref:Uncharacterized protein n=1 Tax=Pleuronectes platessa TaxID=8262 RepID=A0A9N7V6I5_PLEPL|nr:unnamed protein product [Pleuronectes platessa]